MQRSPTATELDRYKPDMSHEPVTANKPQTLKRINALKVKKKKNVKLRSNFAIFRFDFVWVEKLPSRMPCNANQ